VDLAHEQHGSPILWIELKYTFEKFQRVVEFSSEQPTWRLQIRALVQFDFFADDIRRFIKETIMLNNLVFGHNGDADESPQLLSSKQEINP
jgi:hypothetical protein